MLTIAVLVILITAPLGKPQDLMVIREFVRRMKGSKCKMVYSQILEKTAKSWVLIRFGRHHAFRAQIPQQRRRK